MAEDDDAWGARLQAYADAWQATHGKDGKPTPKQQAKIAGEDIAIFTDGLGDKAAGKYGIDDGEDTGGSGGGGGITKSDDSKQLAALNKLIKTTLAKARNTKLANIKQSRDLIVADLKRSYESGADSLRAFREDNEKAASDASFANLLNRARERSSILENAMAQGAGESDTLKAQTMALRNFDANQGDINRSYFDTNTSINANARELESTTRTGLHNAWLDAEGDKEQTWANYYNQLADAYSSKGAIEGNEYSKQFNADSKAYDYMATAAGKSYKQLGPNKAIRDWEGSFDINEGRLNNTQAAAATTNLAEKKPEGATLRSW